MKQIKLMLAAISIIAVVGGTLAFKASNMYSVDYCTSPTSGPNCPVHWKCPVFADDQLQPVSGGTKVCTTTPRLTTNPEHLCLGQTQSPIIIKNCTTDAPIRIEDEE